MPYMSWLSQKFIFLDGILALLNISAWGATVVTWSNVNQLTSLGSTMAATGVSVVTVLWIRKQSKAADKQQQQADERHRLQIENWEEVRRVGRIVDDNVHIVATIPQMHSEMRDEHVLNVGIREMAKETLDRSPSLPEQAAEKEKVAASREEVKRIGKVVDM